MSCLISRGYSFWQELGHSTPNLFSLFCVQKVLSEEEIDDNFKTLFSKLAGDVRQGLSGMVRWGSPV